MPMAPLLKATIGRTRPRDLWLLAEGQFPLGSQAQLETQLSLKLPCPGEDILSVLNPQRRRPNSWLRPP